jgi:cholesterol 24(S)-hydroxylase
MFLIYNIHFYLFLIQVEAKIILAKIMQRFNFELDPDQSFEIEERATLKPKGGVMCTLTLCESVET